ncbi:putative transcription factor WRKY family [Lupinus albus]|uniref:Putative transcription factor WRKY family n=1 Tax=Lupinus albus TaxID=3870 RepID=A0A6A4PRR9_LUPAL|nr:putative transcription factor WRKY family [Lupinus albus]
MGDSSNNLVHELLQGLELVRQLQKNLHMPCSSSQETHELLIQKIISIFEKALQIVNGNRGPLGEPSSQHSIGVTIRMSESPPLSGSPHSEDSDRDLMEHDHNASRKRKSLPRWTKQIRVNPGIGVELPLDDGYNWRKYGQKGILGAVYPRGYYRCTHRNVHGCLATKQVQRSDEDPNVFEITYKGKHTCTMASNTIPTSTPNENQESNLNTNQNVLQGLEQQPNLNELLLNLRAGLRVQTEHLDSSHDQPFSSFHFPSSSNIKTENQILTSPMLENFSSLSFIPPATSEISHFSVSPSVVNNIGGYPSMISIWENILFMYEVDSCITHF